MSDLAALLGAPAEVRELAGVRVPWHYGSVDDEVRAVREAASLSVLPHAWRVRIEGDDARDVLDAAVPRELYVREGQSRATLLLNDDATPFADVYVALDEHGWLLYGEGTSASRVTDLLRARAPAGADVALSDASSDSVLLALSGPFAWEALTELEGPDVLGMSYLTHYESRGTGAQVFRAGKTGEYGFDLWVPRAKAEGLVARMRDACARVGLPLASVGCGALAVCALENHFFDIFCDGARALTPLELQLQWRVSSRKDGYPGAEAMRARRARGITERVTSLHATEKLSVGDALHFGEEPIGRILSAGFSPCSGKWIALAAVALPYAHSGVERYEVRTSSGARVSVRTHSPPALNNRSLAVRPSEHSYEGRDEVRFAEISRLP